MNKILYNQSMFMVAIIMMVMLSCSKAEYTHLNDQNVTAANSNMAIATLSDYSALIGTTSFLILPPSSYDGFSEITLDMGADFTQSNICTTKTIFGLQGTNACGLDLATATSSGDALAGEILLNKKAWVDGLEVTGTIADCTINNSGDCYIRQATKSILDANLTTGNIKAGATIFGISGDLNVVNTSSGDASTSDMLLNKKAWVDGSEITGNITNCTANNGGICYLSNASKSALDSNLATGNILSGVTIFGVAGSVTAEDGLHGPNTECIDGSLGTTDCKVTLDNKYLASNTCTSNNGGTCYLSNASKSALDPNLATSNIKSGITIFGISGSTSVVDTSDATAGNSDLLNGKTAYVNGSKKTGNIADCTTDNGGTCYLSNASKSALDSNLATSNIKSGATIFGINGSTSVVDTLDATSAVGDLLNGKTAYVNGSKITGSMTNHGGYVIDSTQKTPNDVLENLYNYDINGDASIGSAAIAGSAGYYTSLTVDYYYSDFISSNTFRNLGSSQITLTSEKGATGILSFIYPAYREVVSVAIDDDGYLSANVIHGIRPNILCGVTQNNIKDKIDDCFIKNGARSVWRGNSNGNSGEATWKLVTLKIDYDLAPLSSCEDGVGGRTGGADECGEVWVDTRTGLLWSDEVGATHHCNASGNLEYVGAGADEADCTVANGYGGESRCSEYDNLGGGLHTDYSNGYVNEDYGTGVYSNKKGGMGAHASSTPRIFWRLPTKGDLMQADLDGIRFVLPRMHTGAGPNGSGLANQLWAATVRSDDRKYAWSFGGDFGNFDYSSIRPVLKSVHCVGRTEWE